MNIQINKNQYQCNLLKKIGEGIIIINIGSFNDQFTTISGGIWTLSLDVVSQTLAQNLFLTKGKANM